MEGKDAAQGASIYLEVLQQHLGIPCDASSVASKHACSS